MTDPRPFGSADRIDRRHLRELADPRTFDRALDYLHDRRVGAITAAGDSISATVRGSRRYVARLDLVEDELAWSCDCPMGVDGELCKHAVALGLAWLEEREADLADVRGREDGPAITRRPVRHATIPITWDEATAWLGTLEAPAVVAILRSEADQDHGLRDRIIARASAGREDTAAMTAVRRSLDRALHTRESVPYGEAQGYAEGIHAVIDRMDGLLAAGAASAVIDLAEGALHSLEDVMGMIDDSDGEMAGVKEGLEDLHLAACQAASPDPVELAGRLFAWETSSEWEVFYGAARRYADVLGADGLVEYRRLAEPIWATLPRLGPGERERVDEDGRPGHGPSQFRITRIMVTLAELTGDTDGQIEVMARDLSYAYHYLEVAQVCLAAGREDAAIDWAERGVRAFPVRTDGRLRIFLADRYQARGRHDEALDLVWAEFVEQPTVEHYRQLEASATRADAWPAWRGRALEHALSLIEDRAREVGSDPLAGWQDWPARRDASVVVELLLADGDVDGAWSAASAHGCRRSLWLALARAREADQPLDAVPIYQREVEHQIGFKRNDAYRQAAVLVRDIGRLLERAGRAADVPPYLADLRARHRLKRNFIAALDGVRIGR